MVASLGFAGLGVRGRPGNVPVAARVKFYAFGPRASRPPARSPSANAAGPALAQPLPALKILIPANPGGGWDQTSRAMDQALRAEKLVSGPIRLTNRGGAGGTIGLAEFAKAKGEGGSLMTMGLVMVGAILTNKSPVTLEAVTPIARLTSEYLVIVVPASSKVQSLKELTDALRKEPGAVSIAGGSRGGSDQGSLWMTREEWRRSWKPWLRGTLLGFPIGALPAGGAEIPTFLSYLVEKRLSARPEEFGRGAIEGVAGPEAANNASAAGVLAPLLTLGLPTSATAAILLAAFQGYGLQPGPLLFQSAPELVWGLIASLYIDNIMLLVLNLPLAPIWVRLLMIPRPLLYGGILVFALLGAYAANGSVADVVLLVVIGLVGYLMRVFDFPVAPVLVGMILGPLSEQQLRRALAISQGDPSVFLTRPLSATLLLAAAAVLVLPALLARWRRG